MTKYIFVTGGVVSSVGKGIIAASVGRLIKESGYSVSFVKLDPYLNIDPGTLSPLEHGEVFVTEDGSETDLDLGHYERFTGVKMTHLNNVTAGSVYQDVLKKERRGDYNGKTVQIIPHITDEIQNKIERLDERFDFVIVEVGGTAGDIESLPFLEAIRQMKSKHGKNNTFNIHVVLVPEVGMTGELKTKPAQNSVKTLRSYGVTPDLLVCRSRHKLTHELNAKLSDFCGLDYEAVISSYDIDTIYRVPSIIKEQGGLRIILKKLGVGNYLCELYRWNSLYNTEFTGTIDIGLVGKYTDLSDSYLSICEALRHAGRALGQRVYIYPIDSETFHPDDLEDVQAIVVPGGFGERGVEGIIDAISFVREYNIPFLGICLGMQCAVIEWARNVQGFDGANSTEFNKDTLFPVISLLTEQHGVSDLGATLSLGHGSDIILNKDSKSYEFYGKPTIKERHRHRYEFNHFYGKHIEKTGYTLAGVTDTGLVEIIEKKDHPFFIATQFHPEFQSSLDNPHPLFLGLIKSILV